MTSSKEALKLALEALTYSTVSPKLFATLREYKAARVNRDLTITALREALAEQPAQQEPVAVVDDTGVIVVCSYKYKPGDKLYTSQQPAQRTWVGLTIEDKKEYIAQDFGGSRTDAMDWTEKRLMEKNNGN